MLEKRIVRSLLCLAVVLSFWAASTSGANILFVSADETETGYPSDAIAKAFMEGLGHTVTYFDDNRSAAEMQEAALAADLVFIGESSLSGQARQKITAIERPMIWSEYAAWDEEGLTASGGGGSDVATANIEIVNPGHLLAAGFSGTVEVLTNIMGTGHGNAAGTTELLRHSHNLAGNEATVIAKVTLADGNTYDMIFVYEKGARLPISPADGSPQVAADMRICFGFDYKIEVWNDNAFKLLKAAINYALGFRAPPGQAKEPYPANEATDVQREVVLGWEPGEFAAPTNGHKVYSGESFNDVNDATGAAAQDANSYTLPERLDFETTYYWRVDEVNAPPTSYIEFKGDVWQFTTEPIAYPIDGSNITATASSASEGMGPENTINGSGLDVSDLHSIEATDMWLSGGEPNAWIEYEFDKVHKLHEMWVWNSIAI